MSQTHADRLTRKVQDCSTLEYILIGDLRDLLEEPPDATTSHWLEAVLETLVRLLPREFSLQNQGGYLEEVMEQFPSWQRQVEQLQVVRGELFSKLSTLLKQVKQNENYTQIADELKISLRDWMSSLTAYHRHERRLLQNAFNIDLGGGD